MWRKEWKYYFSGITFERLIHKPKVDSFFHSFFHIGLRTLLDFMGANRTWACPFYRQSALMSNEKVRVIDVKYNCLLVASPKNVTENVALGICPNHHQFR